MAELENRLTLLSFDPDHVSHINVNRLQGLYDTVSEFFSKKPNSKGNNTNTFHVVIVGGGIIGIMTAYYLFQEGFKVTVIERKSFGAAASGRNGGGILALGRDLSEIPLAKISIDLWNDLSNQGIVPHFTKSGHLMVALNELEAEKLEKAQHIYSQVGLDTAFLNSKQAIGLVPDLNQNNKGALFSSIDCQGYPFLAISNLIKLLKSNGVTFIDHSEVKSFTISKNDIQAVNTDDATITGDLFVLCTGPWTEQIGNLINFQIPIIPRRSQIMVTEIIKNRVIHPFVSGNALYLRQTHAGNILYGGGGSWEKSGFDTTNTTEAIQLLSTRLIELFPSYQNLLLIRAFAGTVELSPDHFPVCGPVDHLNNTYISAGYSGHGYGISAIFGKLLAKCMSYRIHEIDIPKEIDQLLRDYSPSRFSKL